MDLLVGTGKQRAAKTSRIVIGGDPFAYSSWSVDPKGNDLPTTNFESYDEDEEETYGEGVHGPVDCDIKGGGDWDAGAAGYGDPPGLYPRDDLEDIQFFTSRLDNVFWDFPFQRIRTSSNGGEVGGKVTFTWTGFNQGVFYYPTTSV